MATLARQLWEAQMQWIVLIAALDGLSFLLPQGLADSLSVFIFLLEAALFVHWIKIGARVGGFDKEALQSEPISWWANVGVSLGAALPVILVMVVLTFLLIAISPLVGIVVAGFLGFAALVLFEFYYPLVVVEARGFREAFSQMVGHLLKIDNRSALLEGRFWYPVLLTLAAGFLLIFFNQSNGFFMAVVTFLYSLFMIPWSSAGQLVVYENVWKEARGE
ncbi:hypothetical protein [Oceanithermus sp.]